MGGITSLFKGPKAPRTPAIPEPAVVPQADDQAIERARRRRMAQAQQRGGQQSTILTQGGMGTSETLGGG
jgi:hypothetical protein